jgi:GDP-4-dehydro-6-deoxy-D-mannose reductase
MLALERIKPTWIIHLAGQSSIAKSFSDPLLTYQQNTTTTQHLLEACRLVSPNTTLFFVSSGDVYGESTVLGEVTEDTPVAPLNFYATSKVCAERLVLAYSRDFNLKTVILRPFNHLGVGEGQHNALSQFAQQVARIEHGLAEPTLHVGNLDVERDFLSVTDVVSAYVALIRVSEQLPSATIINICTGVSHTLLCLVNQLLAMSTRDIEVIVDPQKIRPNDTYRVRTNNQKLKAYCPTWQCQTDFQSILAGMLMAHRQKVALTLSDAARF